MPGLTPTQVMHDPEFLALPPDERIKVLRRVDPEFEALEPPARLKVAMSLSAPAAAPAAPAGAAPQQSMGEIVKGILGQLHTTTGSIQTDIGLGAVKGAGRTVRGIGKLAGVVGADPVADAALKPQGFFEGFGHTGESILEASGPGAAAKGLLGGAGLLRTAGRTAIDAVGSAGVTAAQGGGAKEIAAAGGLAAAGPVIGAAVRAIPGRLLNSLIKPLEKEFRFGRDPGTAVAQEGIVAHSKASLLEGIDAKRQEIGQAIGSMLNSAKAQTAPLIDLAPMVKPLQDAVAKAVRVGDEGLANRLRAFADAPIFTEKPIVTPAEAAAIKAEIGAATKWTGDAYDAAVNQAKSSVYRAINDAIDQSVPGVKELNKRYANMLSAEKSLERTMRVEQRATLVGQLPTIGFGTIGTMLGGPAGGLALVAGKKLAETTLARTAGAQGAFRAGGAGAQADLLRRVLTALATKQATEEPVP